MELECYVVKFSDQPDADGNIFSPDTDFGFIEHAQRPVALDIGSKADGKIIGKAEVAVLEDGIHAYVEIDDAVMRQIPEVQRWLQPDRFSFAAYTSFDQHFTEKVRALAGVYTRWWIESILIVPLRKQTKK